MLKRFAGLAVAVVFAVLMAGHTAAESELPGTHASGQQIQEAAVCCGPDGAAGGHFESAASEHLCSAHMACLGATRLHVPYGARTARLRPLSTSREGLPSMAPERPPRFLS